MVHLPWHHHKTPIQTSHPQPQQAKIPSQATEPEEYSQQWFSDRFIQISNLRRPNWQERYAKRFDDADTALMNLQRAVGRSEQVEKGNLGPQDLRDSVAQELRNSKEKWNEAQERLRAFYLENEEIRVRPGQVPWQYKDVCIEDKEDTELLAEIDEIED
ncbi:hypothetical protein MMC10_010892 [Thelotrema lepadinum]|nr:hypothetical protein [Thelotrema lepadinum]